MGRHTPPERSGLIEHALSDAKWLEAFVSSNTGMTGHDWNRRWRAERHVEDVYQLIELASALQSAEARNRVLVEALEPFARIAGLMAADLDDHVPCWISGLTGDHYIYAIHFRRAAEVQERAVADIAAREASRSDGQGKSDGGG